jgi:hypothetical protein
MAMLWNPLEHSDEELAIWCTSDKTVLGRSIQWN